MERNIQLRDGRILRENDLQDVSVVGGGSINQTEVWTYESKHGSEQKFFVKRNQNANTDFFECEARGLDLLRSVKDGPTTPEVLYVSQHLLILEHLELIDGGQVGDADFARRLAVVHREEQMFFGLEESNYLGHTIQKNGIYTDGVAFYRECRIGYLQEKLRAVNKLPLEMDVVIDRICEKMEVFCPSEPPVVVHGDLWSGNWSHVQTSSGSNFGCYFDPAAYVGYRESDLAMMRLFGQPSKRFWDVYTSELPLEKGYEERELVFQLYHILNHVLMFGRTYHHMLAAQLSKINRIL